MKKPSEQSAATFEELIGLGQQSARKNYYPELERKIAELEQERNRYKWLFENALHGIFRAELSGGILAANPAIAQLLGYRDSADLVAGVVSLENQLFIEPGELAVIREQLLSGRRLTGYETRLRCRNGSTVDVAMTILLKREGGREVIEAFVADYTERKRARNACSSSMPSSSSGSPVGPRNCSRSTGSCARRCRSGNCWPSSCARPRRRPKGPIAARTSIWRLPATTCCSR
ncbi:PAS domain S-box protein [Marinobacterium aestuariivivens]|uniref:PAS domain S-box protein n=1 Tax=Marinobacterium aestuariivivens TaxID=1698799 RepID=A0ABW2A4W8_9GAMM